jgi:carbon-monoxide dehydrogenase medium subunit
MRWKHYFVMMSVEETLQRLAGASGRCRVVAGGTDLMVQIVEMDAREESLVLLDISRIKELKAIRESDAYIEIGAAATMTALAESSLIQEKATALAQGAAWLGSPQIRNVATIGGNVVNAQPAADTALPLIALGAEAHIASPKGNCYKPVEALFRGVGESEINPSWELITQFRLPVCTPPRSSSAMQRLARRKAFNLPVVSTAVCVELNEGGDAFSRVRIAAGPVATVPWRAKRAEEALMGAPLSREMVARAAALAREDADPRDSLRGGASYRRNMVEVLTRRAFSAALSRLNKELE